MSLFSWLAEVVRPCVHTWRIVNQMQDDPISPKAVTIIRECEICGALDERKFNGPTRVCPPHKWVQDGARSAVWGEPTDKHPIYYRVHQRCELCGEVRAVDLRPTNGEENNGMAGSTGRGHRSKKGKPAGTSEGVANAP